MEAIINYTKLDYLEYRYIKRDGCNCIEHINFTFTILVVKSGYLNIKINTKNYIVKSNEILLLNIFEKHQCIDCENETEYSVFSVNYFYFKNLLNKFYKNNNILQLNKHIIKNKNIVENFNSLANEFITQNSLKLHHIFNLLLIELFEENIFIAKSLNEYTILDRTFIYIAKHYNKPITLKELADFSKISEQKILYIFNKVYRQTPYQFILSYRVFKSKKLLNKGYSITEVALSVGFYDQSHLHKHFKKHFGITPKEYLLSLSQKK